MKDCMEEWAERVHSENIDRILELGEFIAALPAEQKPLRMTLAASKLSGDGIARSQEEAYVMLMEACVHSEVWRLMGEYDKTLKDVDKYITKMRKMLKATLKENKRLQALVDQKIVPFRVLPEKRKIADA